MFTKINSAALFGLDCIPIVAEVDIAGSWPGYQIVGLPDMAIQEAKERIRTAWKNTGLPFPSNSRIIINLAPADVKKEGSAYDLPMAVGMYLASQKNDLDVSDSLFVGELALDGSLRHTGGILPITLFAKENGFKKIFIPKVNTKEASLIDGIDIFGAQNFQDVILHLEHSRLIPKTTPFSFETETKSEYPLDMADVAGQEYTKRALEIAAAGHHNILMNGPPGSGKTLLARTFPSIVPPLLPKEMIEVTKIYSVAGLLKEDAPFIENRPFRAPHHTASAVSLIGGGKFPRPGEISLSHRGILFLDEFPEFPRFVLETLRGPLEDGMVHISRIQGTVQFPAKFLLIASQNPCPCGFLKEGTKPCICADFAIQKYQKKVSGPILDRIDLHLTVQKVPFEKLTSKKSAESSKDILKRVKNAREKQEKRFENTGIFTNSEMTNKEIKKWCEITSETEALLKKAMETLHLSARSYHRILKLARTIADLDEKENIELPHVAEALQYRGQNQP